MLAYRPVLRERQVGRIHPRRGEDIARIFAEQANRHYAHNPLSSPSANDNEISNGFMSDSDTPPEPKFDELVRPCGSKIIR